MVHSSVPVRIACVVLPISACSFLIAIVTTESGMVDVVTMDFSAVI